MQRFSILGDSISTFQGYNPHSYKVYYQGELCEKTGVTCPSDTWWHQVIDFFDGCLLANSSFSGSLVEGAGFPAGSSTQRIDALSVNGIAPDVVLVFMGINDYGWGGAQAQRRAQGADLYPAFNQLPCEFDDKKTTLNHPIQQFEAAYRLLLERIQATFPCVEVWCCTLCPGRISGSKTSTFAYQLRGIHFDDYNEAIRRSAKRAGCRLVDVRAQGFDYESCDGTHPTAQGMRQLAELVICAREQDSSHIPHPAEPLALDAHLRSVQSCHKPSCLNCALARDTGKKWSLVCENEALL